MMPLGSDKVYSLLSFVIKVLTTPRDLGKKLAVCSFLISLAHPLPLLGAVTATSPPPSPDWLLLPC